MGRHWVLLVARCLSVGTIHHLMAVAIRILFSLLFSLVLLLLLVYDSQTLTIYTYSLSVNTSYLPSTTLLSFCVVLFCLPVLASLPLDVLVLCPPPSAVDICAAIIIRFNLATSLSPPPCSLAPSLYYGHWSVCTA